MGSTPERPGPTSPWDVIARCPWRRNRCDTLQVPQQLNARERGVPLLLRQAHGTTADIRSTLATAARKPTRPIRGN
jgi:hypothetical protein